MSERPRGFSAQEQERIAAAKREKESEDWNKAAEHLMLAEQLIWPYYPQFSNDVGKKARYCRERGVRALTIDGA